MTLVAPQKLAVTGALGEAILAEQRDPVTGRFLPGHAGTGGRPRGLDLRAVVDDYANREGFDVPAALWRIMRTLLERAEAGDQNAAKLVLDRLCGSVAEAAGLAFRMESRNGQSLEELLARSWKIEVVTGVSEPSPVSK